MYTGSIDRADWHYESTEEEYRKNHSITGELSPEQINEIWLLAANHIGLFVQWIIDRGFEGEESDPEGCRLVRERKITGSEYLMEYCDGKLWWGDIREDLYPFVKEYYYDDTATYLTDYCNCCLEEADAVYAVITREEKYSILKDKMDQVYADYLKKQ